MRRGTLNKAALLACAIAALAASGCGPEDKVVQRQALPTVEVGKIDVDEIKPIPQAPNFTGVPKDVALAVDRFVVAFNENDAEYLCTKGYTKVDLEALDAGGKCVETLKKAGKIFGGYQMQIEEITVDGDTATVKARAITKNLRTPDKALVTPYTFKFVKEDGEWRLSINAAQNLPDNVATGTTGAAK